MHLVDIDKDGFIDQFDLETFLKRHIFIEEHMLEVNNNDDKAGKTCTNAENSNKAKLSH